MAITWRNAVLDDIEPCLGIQPKLLGGALIRHKAAIEVWKQLVHRPLFLSAVIVSDPLISGHRYLGLGAGVLVSPAFADAEIANSQPDINSRIISSVHSGQPALATQDEVAKGNEGQGVDVAVMYGAWRDEVLTTEQRARVQTLYPLSFSKVPAGYRVRRILNESVDEAAKDFLERSVVYLTTAEFPEFGRTIHLMTLQSVRAVPASIGNIIFAFNEPLLRLRESDQQLLLLAQRESTDKELAGILHVTVAAVKARSRSAFARIADTMPTLVSDDEDSNESRGKQKRHRVLAYVRCHPEELRPYEWRPTASYNGSTKRTSAGHEAG